MNKNQIEFPVSIYGKLEPVNDVLSKARVRIFYKYGNRNGTYITDEFADELVTTLPGVPVKGIYDGQDFTDHGTKRSEGQVYGFVPENNNFAWEDHLDEDGVMRNYACCDVLLFTALFPEASQIIDKGESMELFAPTLKYHYAIINGLKYVVFEHGSFLGLQVLGNEVEPCFEGASFYSLQQQIQDTIDKIKQYSTTGGNSTMNIINFKLSDRQKFDALWTLINENYDEEHEWEVDYSICDIFDDYALVYKYDDGTYECVYYVKNDEEDSIVINKRVKCYVVDVTEEEKSTLDTLRKLNGDTYELVNENLINAEDNANKCVEFSTKIDELNGVISTLQSEAETAQAKISEIETQYSEATAQIDTLSNEVQNLREYQLNIENQHKEAVIAEYTDKLPEEVIGNYKANLTSYTVEDLDMHLAYELKKIGSLFKNEPKEGYIPKDTHTGDSVNEILARYKK